MNKSPAFQFYPKDFLMDDKVAVMNLDQIGAYVLLLCYQWQNDGIPIAELELKQMCKNPENWDEIWGKVGRCFYENKGKLFNKRLQIEKKKQKEWKKMKKEAGKKGAEIRWSKPNRNNNINGTPNAEPLANDSPPFSSSIPSPKEDIKISSNIYPPKYEKFWKSYPRKKEKKAAFLSWKGLSKKDQDEIINAAILYAFECEYKKTGKQYIKHPKTFISKDRWKDYSNMTEAEFKELLEDNKFVTGGDW